MGWLEAIVPWSSLFVSFPLVTPLWNEPVMRRARLMVDDPTAMAPSSASDDGRLVQKIFFPSFVDAGGNESFDGVKQHHQQQNTNTISKGGFVVADQQQQRRRMRMPNDDIVGDDGALDRSSSCGLNESVASEASTAVRDNRSSNHPILVFGQKANKNNHNKPFPPSFFASTKPLVLSTAAAAAATTAMPIPPSPAAAVPMSPPKLTRRATATTTTNNNTTYAAAPVPAVLTRRFPFVDTDDDDNQNNSGESVFQDATGIAIVPASFATATSKSRLEEDLDQNVGEVYPWRNDDIHKEGVMESDSTSTSTTATSSRLPPKSLFDEDDTVVTANGPLFIDNGAVVVDPVAWEEEATPDQTAFGKMLLFRRVLRTNSENKDDDVSSTASENGSLVNDGVDGAIPAAYAAVVDESNNRKVTTVTGITANTSSDDEEESSEYTTPQQHEYSEPIWDEATLALPVFLESNTTTNSNSNQNIGSIISGIPDDGHYRIGSSKTILTSNETSKTAIRNNGDCSPPSKQEEEDCAESSAKPSVIGTTGLLSMAIRRLGSGLTSTTGSSNINNNMRSKCVSAPTTPLASSYGGFSHFTGNDNGMMQSSPLGRQVTLSARDEEDAITPRPSFPNPTSFAFSPKQQQQPSSHLPSSFLLRSPGSLAFQAASTKSLNNGGKGPIPPRFAYWHGGGNQQNHRRQVFSKIPEDDVAARDENSKSTRLINSNPFYIARSCFSFDAYDTSVNDQHELYADNQTSQLYSREQPSQSTLSARQSEVLNVDARGNASLPVPSTGQFIQESTSWDFGGATQPQRQHHSSAFRPRSGHTRGGNAQPLRVSKSFNVSPSRKSTRERLTSNYSPTLESRGINDTETQELKSPQRLEIEREDALDILSCLVERGVSWKESHPTKKDLDSTSIRIENCKASDDQNVKPTVNTVNDNMTAYADIESIVRELQELSLAEEKLGDFHNNSKSHQTRILALEELLRSHQYALEMKRASHSASSWLHSIGRSQSSSPSKSLSPARNVILSEETTTLDSPSQVNTSDSETTRHSQQVAGEESSASDSIDLLTAKAMLHTIQMEAKEKSDLADKLNEELVSHVVD